MSHTGYEMELYQAILSLIEQKRQESGDPLLGSSVERVVLEKSFEEVERDILENPGAIEPWLIRRRKSGEE